jgi:hypothetical protein
MMIRRRRRRHVLPGGGRHHPDRWFSRDERVGLRGRPMIAYTVTFIGLARAKPMTIISTM